MAIASHRNRTHGNVDMSAIRLNIAVFAAHLAIRCHFFAAIVPLLPPITRNVKFARGANRLEFGTHEENVSETKSKSGKNGNVDHPSQLCRPPLDDMDGP